MDPTASNPCGPQSDLHNESTGEPEEEVASQGTRSTDPRLVADEPQFSVHMFTPGQASGQKKRVRRHPEEIDRLYKCGWNGCPKAYGSITNLNTHVSLKGHGPKRTLDEFAELRKQQRARQDREYEKWLAQEESRRKAQDHPNAPAPGVASAQPPTGVEKGIHPTFGIRDYGKQ